MNASVDAHGDADQCREQRGHHGQFEGGGKTGGEHARDWLLDLIGHAEIEIGGLPHEAPELHGDRVIQSQVLAQLVLFLERRVLTDQLVDRIADETEQHE